MPPSAENKISTTFQKTNLPYYLTHTNILSCRMNNPEPSPEVRLNNVNTENDNEIIRNNVRSHPDEQKTVKIKFTKDREVRLYCVFFVKSLLTTSEKIF